MRHELISLDHSSGIASFLIGILSDEVHPYASEPTGSVGLIHLESHFTDEKAGALRGETYRRLRRHWQFINELQLFDIQHQKRYGVNVYSSERTPLFSQAAHLYHPDTVARSLEHDGSGTEPGIKDPEGNWDLRPHAARIVRVDTETLRSWHAVLENGDVPISQTRMVYAVNAATARVLEKIATAPRIADLGLSFSSGWHEKNDRTRGLFDSEWGAPESWDSVILQGPHLFVGTPFYKTPNESMLHHLDWTETDFEALAPDAIPVTAYKPRGDKKSYDASYTSWKTDDGSTVSARSNYRVAWRNMAANTGERTLIPAIIPPGAAHVHTVYSFGSSNSAPADLVLAGGALSSLIGDFGVRCAPKSSISWDTANRLPLPRGNLAPELLHRTLRLNCITEAYADLWETCYRSDWRSDAWVGGLEYRDRVALSSIGPNWTPHTPLRRAVDRRQALLEIDAIVAIMLGITIDELITIYKTQFPVMEGYDRSIYIFDSNGRRIPNDVASVWRKRGGNAGIYSPADLTAKNSNSGIEYLFELPFSVRDRETDLREAYSDLYRRSANRSENST